MKSIFQSLLLIALTLPMMLQADTSKLVERIAQAQKHLSVTERRIANERQFIAKQLNQVEQEVLLLREKAALAQRLADEKTLSLSKLEERLNSWQQQQTYQQNLLHRFLQQHGEQATTNQKIQADTYMAAAIAVAEELQQRFQPSWQTTDIVLSTGEISPMPTLSIGPITWYWNTLVERAGLASNHDNNPHLLHSDLLLSANDSNAIARLLKQPVGDIVFDPTLTRALARQQHSENVIQHLKKGGLWTIPIMLFALFALAIALLKANQLLRLPKLIRFTPSALTSALENPESQPAKSVKGMQKNLLAIANSHYPSRQRDDQLFMQLQDDKQSLDRWIGGIAITAAICPLLGLLGTVSGMIDTFKMMTLFGSGDPEVVSGGIAQALITTELGLVVAIPALILNALLSRRAKNYYNELESFAILVSKAEEVAEHSDDTPTATKSTLKQATTEIPTVTQGSLS